MAGEADKQADKQTGAGEGFALFPRSLGVKVGILIGLSIIIAGGFILYVLYARGVFEQTQRLYLITDNAEGVHVGSDLSFAGFPIGRVRRISLTDDGKVRISVRVPVDDAKWLRSTSIFVLDVPLVGAVKLRAFTASLDDPPLPDRAERPVLRGDTAQEIPKMVATLRTVLEHLDRLTDSGSSLQQSLDNARVITERMAGKHGVLGGVLGSEDNAKKIIATIDRANALLASLGGVSLKLDRVLSQTEQRVFNQGGIADETQKAVAQANAILAEMRASLKTLDAILADTKVATTDLGLLRAEVDASLRKISALVDELNRKWPFARDSTKVKLP